jgi:hypothetical protein
MTGHLGFPVRILGGFAWKLSLLLLIVAGLAVGSKWYRLHRVSSFCNVSLRGITRAELSRRAEDAGLRVVLGESQDEVVNDGIGLGLAWCRAKQDGKHIESVAFAGE